MSNISIYIKKAVLKIKKWSKRWDSIQNSILANLIIIFSMEKQIKNFLDCWIFFIRDKCNCLYWFRCHYPLITYLRPYQKHFFVVFVDVFYYRFLTGFLILLWNEFAFRIKKICINFQYFLKNRKKDQMKFPICQLSHLIKSFSKTYVP